MIDLYEITKKYNKADHVFIRNAIKSAIIKEKLKNPDIEIKFRYRPISINIKDKLMDLYVNGCADNILQGWNKN